MIDLEVAKEMGLTNERLKEFFTAAEGSDEWENRDELETVISSRINQRIEEAMEDYHLYSSVDMAWDAAPIQKYTIPLMMYAQGRVTAEVATKLDTRGDIKKYVQKSDKQTTLQLPKFFDTNINLVRSVITRRLAAQGAKYNSLTPHFKYHPRLQTQEGRFRADVLSERVDIIADQYGYRHIQMQEMRNMLLYGHQFSFPACSWEKDHYVTRDQLTGKRVSRVFREGINWVLPHPTRAFYDISYPASSLNTDTGCEYCGYWDVETWGRLQRTSGYFNLDQVSWNHSLMEWFNRDPAYFNQNIGRIILPTSAPDDLTSGNDRELRIGYYAGADEDASVMLVEYFMKLRPNEWGICDYPEPVWIRLKVAGERTIIYAEVMPSSPCAVYSYNEHDGRLNSISLAHEVMKYQDALTNLFTDLLETIKRDLFTVGILNEDAFGKDEKSQEVKEKFKRILEGREFYSSTAVLAASFEEMAESGVDIKNVFHFVQAPPNQKISDIFRAINQLLDMLDRLMALSPQELGQTAPREVTATEVAAIATTTESVYGMISDAIDEARAAKKRIIYESLINKASDTVDVSIKASYPPALLESLGFTVEVEDYASGLPNQEDRLRVKGLVSQLVHDYSFSSRDGAERVNNPQTAMTLIQLFQQIAGQQIILNAMGKEKVYEIINTIFRLAGTGVNTNLQLKPGEDDSFVDQSAMGEAMNEMFNVVGEQNNRIQALEQILQQQASVPQNEAILKSDSELARDVARQQF